MAVLTVMSYSMVSVVIPASLPRGYSTAELDSEPLLRLTGSADVRNEMNRGRKQVASEDPSRLKNC